MVLNLGSPISHVTPSFPLWTFLNDGSDKTHHVQANLTVGHNFLKQGQVQDCLGECEFEESQCDFSWFRHLCTTRYLIFLL